MSKKKLMRPLPGKSISRAELLAKNPAQLARHKGAIKTTKSRGVANLNSSPPKKEVPMENKKALLKTLEHDSTEAARRLAGSQLVKLCREPVIGFLSRQLGSDETAARARVAAFLDTEIGEALLAAMLSLGLSALPTPMAGEIPKQLAKELRVRSMAGMGDVVADVLMGPLRQVMVTYLQGVSSEKEPAALPERSESVVSFNQNSLSKEESNENVAVEKRLETGTGSR